MNIIFKLEPCINHIKVLDEKTGELDHDLKGQIGLETSNILVLIFFKICFRILPSNLNCLLIIKVSHMILKIGDSDLYLQDQIGLQTFKIFILTVKHRTTLNVTF